MICLRCCNPSRPELVSVFSVANFDVILRVLSVCDAVRASGSVRDGRALGSPPEPRTRTRSKPSRGPSAKGRLEPG